MKRRKFIKLLITSVIFSSSVSFFYNDNFVKAENYPKESAKISQKDEILLSEKNISEGKIIADYVILKNKNGVYQYILQNDDSLDRRLLEIGSELTSKDISSFVKNINYVLKKENGNGELTFAIKNIKESNQYTITRYTSPFRSDLCTWSFWGLSGATGAIYSAAASLGAAGPVGWAGFAAGLAIGAVGNVYCKYH